MNSLSYQRTPHSSCNPDNLKPTLNSSSHAPIQSLSSQSRPVYQNPTTPIIDKQFCGLTKHRKQNEERKLKKLTHGQYETHFLAFFSSRFIRLINAKTSKRNVFHFVLHSDNRQGPSKLFHDYELSIIFLYT